MSKYTIKGGLYFYVKDGRVHEQPTFNEYDLNAPFVKACDCSFEVEVPDDFDPRPGALAMLDKQEQDVRAEFGKRITELQEQRNKLLCLEMTA